MSSHLANAYAFLLRAYGESCTLTYSEPPSYLSKIVGQEKYGGKVVFIYQEDRSKPDQIYASPTNLLMVKDEAIKRDMDLTGSPLKDDCVVEAIEDISLNIKIREGNLWKIEEECQKGIPIEKARYIMCKEDFQFVDPDAKGSIWILCNGADVNRTLLLQYDFSPCYFIRGIITYSGLIHVDEVKSQSLMRQHHLTLKSRTSTGQVETYIENIYQIKSNISVRCCWSSTAALPSLIDLTSCEVTLRQSFRLIACNELTEDFMNQLRILTVIKNDIIEYKSLNNCDAEGRIEALVYRCGCGIDTDELRESINRAVTEISGLHEMDSEESSNKCDIESVVQRIKIRRLTDLTDKLWEILKRCSSYKDLKMAFTLLFKCAAHCNIVNTPTNKNRLAEIITEVANKRLALPCLTGSEPLELLLEIGLEKLYRDYELIFDESKICSPNDLKSKSLFDSQHNDEKGAMPNVRKSLRNAVHPDPAAMRKTLLHNKTKGDNKFDNEETVGFKNSSFDETVVSERLAKLLQVHCVLEHILMIHDNLNLSNVYSEVCDQLLSKPLRFVDNIDENLVDEIEISLSAHDVREHLEGKIPQMRRISIRSENKLGEVKSTFYYNMNNICPPGVAEYFQSEEKEACKEITYYSWMYLKIKTLQ